MPVLWNVSHSWNSKRNIPWTHAAENWKSIYPGGDTCEQSSQSLQVLLIDTLEIDQLTCRECVATAICNCSRTAAEIEDGAVTEFLEVSRHSTMAFANAFHTLWFLYCCEFLVLWIRRSFPWAWHLKISYFVTKRWLYSLKSMKSLDSSSWAAPFYDLL